MFSNTAIFLHEQSKASIQNEDGSLSSNCFWFNVLKRANSFKLFGISALDRVIVSNQRGSRYWIDIVALWSLGATVVPLEESLSNERKNYIKSFVAPAKHISDFYEIEKASNSVKPLSTPKTSGIAAILFTSGSSGEPKGVELSHESLIGNAISTQLVLQLSPHDKLLMAIPFTFTSALSHFLVSFAYAGTFVCTEKKFLPADFINWLHLHPSACFGGSPLQLYWICSSEQHYNLKWLMSSGDHLPLSTIKSLHHTNPHLGIFTVYGLTEVGGRFCILDKTSLSKHAGSVGKPINGLSASIVNHEQVCRPGETGEIHIKGEWLFQSYFNKNTIHGPHGFSTGDMGHIDEDGYLYISGRKDDIFKVNGLKVSSIEVQELLKRSGLFDDLAVMPSQDECLGTIPALFYVPKKPKLQQAEITKYARQYLPSYAIPRKFIQVQDIPRTGSDKIQRSVLKAMLSNPKLENLS